MHKNNRLEGWYYVKNVLRHQHDKTRLSRIATVDSCFARQHGVTKICNANQRTNAHKLRNDPFTISTCFRAQDDQIATIGVSKSKQINAAGQSQPKHRKPHGQYHALKRSVSDHVVSALQSIALLDSHQDTFWTPYYHSKMYWLPKFKLYSLPILLL